MRSVKEIFRSHAVFDAEGRHTNGTDKQSNHNYGDAYEAMFPEHPCRVGRDDVKLMMEVGVADGSCLRAWREVFPNATVVGMDIQHSDKAHGDRIEFHLGDQRSMADCERAAAGRQFDMIVDDATHLLTDTVLTLFWLWPYVKPGGLYVIEESPLGFDRINSLCPYSELVNTQGPFGGVEPLVVFRKPT